VKIALLMEWFLVTDLILDVMNAIQLRDQYLNVLNKDYRVVVFGQKLILSQDHAIMLKSNVISVMQQQE
jgi:hypothetical protein